MKLSVFDGTSESGLTDLSAALSSVTDMEIGPDDVLYLSSGNALYRMDGGTLVLHTTLPGDETTTLVLDSSTWGLVANSDYDRRFYKINPDGSFEDILKENYHWFGLGFAVDNTGKVCFNYEGVVCVDSAGDEVWTSYSYELEFDRANLAYTTWGENIQRWDPGTDPVSLITESAGAGVQGILELNGSVYTGSDLYGVAYTRDKLGRITNRLFL